MDPTAYARWFELEQKHFWRVARRKLIVELVEQHLPPTRPLRLLDVGGACSLIAKELQRFGEVTVIEPDAATAEFSRRELGLDTRVGRLPDELPVEGRFEVITLLDVLEHIEDDVEALQAIHARLQPDGVLIVTVPALQWLWSAHDVSVHHKRRYDRAGLRRVLRAGGFEVERLSYHTSLLLPAVAAQRLASKLRGVPEKAEYDVQVPAAPLNRLFGKVMQIEQRLFSKVDLPLGSSLVAVCRPDVGR